MLHHPLLALPIAWLALIAVVLKLDTSSLVLGVAPTAAIVVNYYLSKRQRKQIAKEAAAAAAEAKQEAAEAKVIAGETKSLVNHQRDELKTEVAVLKEEIAGLKNMVEFAKATPAQPPDPKEPT